MDNIKIEVISNGYRPLCYVGEKLFVYKNLKFYLMDLSDYSLEYIVELKSSLKHRIISKNRMLVRLFRLEPRIGIVFKEDKIIVSFKGRLYKIDILKKKMEIFHEFRKEMSNPLNMLYINDLEGFDNQICYGEYFTNFEKKEVNIYSYNLKNKIWEIKYIFAEGKINHIHSLIKDTFRNRIWILTGDFDEAAGIYYTDDNFKTVKEFLVGKQLYRACIFIPVNDGIIYATDSPDEDNSINFIDLINQKSRIKKLYKLDGSCIYGTEIHDGVIFSTTVEPKTEEKNKILSLISYKRGKGIKSWRSSVVLWNKKNGCIKLLEGKKDFYPMGLFQFGTMIFPDNKKNKNEIVCYGIALKKYDGKILKIRW